MAYKEIVAPIINENGVEFYISNDGTRSGVSQVGLARLCGVSETWIRKVLSNAKVSTSSKGLEGFEGDVYHTEMTSEQQAKIVTTEAATEIIFYYAFESPNTNETAQFSAKKFAKQGMHEWIKEISKFSANSDHNSLNETMKALMSSVNALTEEVKDWKTVRRVADSRMGGINILVDQIVKQEASKEDIFNPRQIAGDVPNWSLAEWLSEFRGATLSRGKMSGLGRMTCETYKSLRQQDPPKDYRNVNGNKSLVSVYTREDFAILQVAYSKFVLADLSS
ncbi:RNA polymerase sigma factor [Pseudanabaena phage Pam2]|nr:RNA polymerase sigma factor [Pseudanabaena phage Pam2]